MSDLLPCPFCGGTPYFERLGTGRQSCIVECGSCGVRHDSGDEGAMCGTSWNTRAATHQVTVEPLTVSQAPSSQYAQGWNDCLDARAPSDVAPAPIYPQPCGGCEGDCIAEVCGYACPEQPAERATAPQATMKGDERFSPEVMKEVLEALGTIRATWELNGFNDEADKLGVFIDAHK